MARRVPLVAPPEFRAVAFHHAAVDRALRLDHSPASPDFTARFEFDTPSEVRTQLTDALDETAFLSSFALLASIEAAFRVDYIQRHYGVRRRDPISRALRALYTQKQLRASLSGDILDRWKTHAGIAASLISDIRAAFHYRDWLAHGRYWKPRLGRTYDYPTIYDLALAVDRAFPFLTL